MRVVTIRALYWKLTSKEVLFGIDVGTKARGSFLLAPLTLFPEVESYHVSMSAIALIQN
jgi:hypothetical protein